MSDLQNRYDFVLFFDVTDGNPNGDPDAGNLPRMDPETDQGLVSDVSLKRKIRNYVTTAKENEPGHEIYMTEQAVLNEQHAKAYEAQELSVSSKLLAKDVEAHRLTRWMCDHYFDIRTFGAVMTTEVNCGQVRGPVQFTFARSIEAVMPLEITITRSSVTNEKDRIRERTMGRKHIVPYALYRVHGFINPKLAQKTGFSEADLETFWTALRDMFEYDRSAARGQMASRRLIAFRHESALGNASAHKLFERVSVLRRSGENQIPIDRMHPHNLPPARSFADYQINLDRSDLPEGISIVDPF